jgi:phospholipid/cholesterol/gamma-HCH transport system substrate-binding protein
MTRKNAIFGVGAALVVLVLVIGGLLVFRSHGKQVTAYFSETIGVYPGSTVRVLGVPVGTVNSVVPDGTKVKVVMTLNPGVAVPANASAVIISPSVVADRYVQLTPAYTGGPQIADGAVIPVARTAVPVEVDQVYSSLAKLANALSGANSRGALSEAIKTGAANLAGNGGYLRAMITQFSGLSKTLGGSANNLYASIAYLQSFTTMLKNNNGQVKLAERQLAEVSVFLASDRQDLSAAIGDLAVALNQVKSFIGSNRSLIDANVSKLAAITSILSRERASLAQTLDTVPLLADNLVNAYDTTSHTLDSRGDLNEFSIGKISTMADTGSGMFGPAGSVPVPVSELDAVPPLPLPTVGGVYGTPQTLLDGGHR